MSKKIVFDISSVMRWSGPPVGIQRVESELARWARTHLNNIIFACFDPIDRVFRELRPEWIDPILAGDAVVWEARDPRDGRRSCPLSIDSLRRLVRRLRRGRRTTILALERLRSAHHNSQAVARAEFLQSILMGRRHRRELIGESGKRRSLLTWTMATASNLALDANTVIVEAGSPWWHLDIDRFQEMKRTTGCRYAIFCYDIIPLQFPEFFPARHVARFRSYYDAAFPLTDLVIFGARRVEHDVRAYCADHGLSLGQSAVVPLGADPFHGRERGPADLPAGLVAGRYALLVGTIEPRKGHALLLRIWLRLLTEKIPEETGFRLVFVGRPGWMVGGLMRDLRDRKRIGGTIVVLEGASDATLGALYANAAFCLLPSTYEGYGLPIVEAFSHGKAVIASTGGAVPEVVGSLSPCIDLRDEEAWYDTLKAWITGGGSRLRFEEEIRRRFSHPTWDEAASLFFGAIDPEITGAMNVAGLSTCQEQGIQ